MCQCANGATEMVALLFVERCQVMHPYILTSAHLHIFLDRTRKISLTCGSEKINLFP